MTPSSSAKSGRKYRNRLILHNTDYAIIGWPRNPPFRLIGAVLQVTFRSKMSSPATPSPPPDDQSETVAFLRGPGQAEVVQTHGAYVFLSGDTAIKLKRAVRYDYMDLSTPELRQKMLRRELELNRPAAPQIYRDVVAVTREACGTLALDGRGVPVDWVLRMHRFPAAAELPAIAAHDGIGDDLALQLGEAVHGYLAAAPRRDVQGDRLIGDILDELDRVLAEFADDLGHDRIAAFVTAARRQLASQAALLRQRATQGHVRRGHGDLHLRNIVLLDGRPVLYDALEFDEILGTCDVLYDLGFLIMDLSHRGLTRAAVLVLSAFLDAAQGAEDAGLAALPLFLAVRAAIRAMVLAQTDSATGARGRSTPEAVAYLDQAIGWLAPPAPVLIAMGGPSGTGKSVLARAIAPGLGAAPGAAILRTDTLRGPGPHDYSPAGRAAIYDRMFDRARALLAAGQSVILDATFLDPGLQAAAAALAATAGVPFRGFWLSAPFETLAARIAGRHGDSSEADVAVLRAQLATRPDAPGWVHLDAGPPPDRVAATARAALPPAR